MLKLAGITQGRKQVNKGITGGCLVINQNQRSCVGNTTSFLFIIWQIDQMIGGVAVFFLELAKQRAINRVTGRGQIDRFTMLVAHFIKYTGPKPNGGFSHTDKQYGSCQCRGELAGKLSVGLSHD